MYLIHLFELDELLGRALEREPRGAGRRFHLEAMPFARQRLGDRVKRRNHGVVQRFYPRARRFVRAEAAFGRAAFRFLDGATQPPPDVGNFHMVMVPHARVERVS